MIAALLAGLGLGFSAGISPGPLLSLVISTTLARGFLAGARVAAAPLASDLLIVPACVLLISALPPWFEPLLSIVGGLFVIWLGVKMVGEARHATLLQPITPHSGLVDVRRGIAVNVLSPNPWLFWIAVGAPLVVGYWRADPWHALLFIAAFYTLLVGVKVAIAGVIAAAILGARKGGGWFTEDAWRLLLLLSAGLLLFFGLLLVIQGLRLAL